MILIGLVERLHQHLHRPTHLIAELVGDFLLIACAFVEQANERFIVRHAEEPV